MYFDVVVFRDRTLVHSPSFCFTQVCIYPYQWTKPLNFYNCSSSSLVTPPNSSCADLLSSSVRSCQTWGVSLFLVPSFQQQLAHPAAVWASDVRCHCAKLPDTTPLWSPPVPLLLVRPILHNFHSSLGKDSKALIPFHFPVKSQFSNT